MRFTVGEDGQTEELRLMSFSLHFYMLVATYTWHEVRHLPYHVDVRAFASDKILRFQLIRNSSMRECRLNVPVRPKVSNRLIKSERIARPENPEVQ